MHTLYHSGDIMQAESRVNHLFSPSSMEGRSSHNKAFSACAMCTDLCYANHGYRDQAEAEIKVLQGAPSFLKIIRQSNDNHKARFLGFPLTFMEEHGYRIDDTLTLEGPTGYTCNVPLVFRNGQHGLSTGFGAFFKYHGLEVGDNVLFTLTANSHLVVKIYSKLGCQKTDFPGDVNEPKSLNSHLSHDLGNGRGLRKRRNRVGTISSTVAGRKRHKVNHEQQEDESKSRRGEMYCSDQDLLRSGSFKYVSEHRENGGLGVQEEVLGSEHHENGGLGVQGEELGSEHHENGGFGIQEEEKLVLPERIQQLIKQSSLFFEKLEKHLLLEKTTGNNPSAQLDEGKDNYSRNPARTILAWIRPEKHHSNKGSPSPHEENHLCLPKNISLRDTGCLRLECEGSILNSKTAAAVGEGWCFQPKRSCSQLFDPHVTGVHNGHALGYNMHKNGSAAIDPAVNPGQDPQHPSVSHQQHHYIPQVHRAIKSKEKNLTSGCHSFLRIRPPEENRKRKEMLEAAEALKSKTYPSAVMAMTRTYLTRGYTVVPKVFGRKWLPLKKKAILLEDTTGQTWPVVYNPSKRHHTGHLGRGWSTFARDKHLKEGDLCVLEMKSPYSNNLFVHVFQFADYKVHDHTEGHVSHALEPSRHGNGSYKGTLSMEETDITGKPPTCEKITLGSPCKKRDMTRSEQLNARRKSRETTTTTTSEEEPTESLTKPSTAKYQFSSLRNMATAEAIEKVHSVQRGSGKTYSSGDSLETQGVDDLSA